MSQPATLSVKQVVEAHGALQALIAQDRQNKFVFPSAVRIKLSGNLRKTRPVFDEYQEERNTLIRTYGTPDLDKDGKDTGNLSVKTGTPEHDKFTAENNALLEANTGEVLNPISEKDLGENQVDIELIGVLQDVGLLV